MPVAPSPSRTAPHQMKKYRCARRVLFLPVAPATCTEMCRRWFLLPSSTLSASPPSASSHSPMGLQVSPIRNPAASLLSVPTQCFLVLSPYERLHCGAPYSKHLRSVPRTLAPAPAGAAPCPTASPASLPPRIPSPDNRFRPDDQCRAERRCGGDSDSKWSSLPARGAVCAPDRWRTPWAES